MTSAAVLINEIPFRIGRDRAFVNSWSYEAVFRTGADGLAYRDTSGAIRINPRMLLENFEPVATWITTLGAGRWTHAEVALALQPALKNLLGYFEVFRGPLGSIVRLSRAAKLRLKGNPKVHFCVQIAEQTADRQMIERRAMTRVANTVSF